MKIDNYQKVVCNIYDKKNYVVHIKDLKKLLAIEMKKIIIKKNKPMYLVLSILDISKAAMCMERWLNYAIWIQATL